MFLFCQRILIEAISWDKKGNTTPHACDRWAVASFCAPQHNNISAFAFISEVLPSSLLYSYCNSVCLQIDAWGTDGEVLQVTYPSEQEVADLVATSEKEYRHRLGFDCFTFIVVF